MSGATARAGSPRPSGRSGPRGSATRSALRARVLEGAPAESDLPPGAGGSGGRRGSRGSLRVVPQARRRVARGPFLVGVVVVLGIGLLALLGLNTLLAQDSFHLHALQVSSKQLADQEQELQRQVDGLQAPAALAAAAQAQGMVLGGPPVFLRLPDGTVLGDPVPATSPPAPPPVTPSPGTPAAVAPGTGTSTGATAAPTPGTTPRPSGASR